MAKCRVYKCKTIEERILLVLSLINLGWNVDNLCTDGIYQKHDFDEYPYVGIDEDNDITIVDAKYASGDAEILKNKEDLLIPFIRPVIFELNDEYTAEITAGGIVVGCQTFTFEILEALIVEARKFKKKLK